VHLSRCIRAFLLVPLTCLAFAGSAAAQKQTTPVTATSAPAADCPQSLNCIYQPAVLVSASTEGAGSCSYSYLGQAESKRQFIGVVEHTTEESTSDALSEAQNYNACISWNYLVTPNGTIYETVPLNAVTYDAANWYFNSDYVRVKNIGHAGMCDVTPAEYAASSQLVAYLASKFNFPVNASTIIGHENVPGTDDQGQADQHWDPGICWNWNKFLSMAGAPAITPSSNDNVVTIDPTFSQNHHPVTDCTDGSECSPTAVNNTGTNFLYLYTTPSSSRSLLSDPYLQPDGSPGTEAMNDWGDKVETGHSYAVAQRQPGWTAI
jgi:hypothetical protein